jgi:hypothetical protein
MEFAYEYDEADKRYTVTVTGGEAGDGQEIYDCIRAAADIYLQKKIIHLLAVI